VAVSLGVYYDGKAIPTLYFYSSTGLTGATTTTPSPTAFGQPPVYGGARLSPAPTTDGSTTVNHTNLPTVTLQPSFFIQTNAASTKTMVVDYFMASCEISRF
jgi:hypothetical protein